MKLSKKTNAAMFYFCFLYLRYLLVSAIGQIDENNLIGSATSAEKRHQLWPRDNYSNCSNANDYCSSSTV